MSTLICLGSGGFIRFICSGYIILSTSISQLVGSIKEGLATVPADDYDHALHVDHPDALSLLQQYLDNLPLEPRLGGAPLQTLPGNAEGKVE